MARKYTGLKRYILVKNGKIFDTTFIFPHVECYFIEDNKFYSEDIDGDEFYLGVIVAESDSLKDIEKAIEAHNG